MAGFVSGLLRVGVRPVALALLATATVACSAEKAVRLAGNTRPEATAQHDLGPVDDGLPLEHILLELKRPPERQAALDAWMAGLQDKSSANYHQWLTAEEFGARFGLTSEELEPVVGWLTAAGLTVHGMYANRMTVDISATAGQVSAVFRTEIHAYDVDGARHIANVSDPAVPAELAPWIAGIVSLHDFRPAPQLRTRHTAGSRSTFTIGSGAAAEYAVTAADVATIYNLTPLFKAGYTGKGETIALIEDSDVHAAADWTAFRTAFGLSAYTTATLTQVHPAPATGTNNCADPGAIPAETRTILRQTRPADRHRPLCVR